MAHKPKRNKAFLSKKKYLELILGFLDSRPLGAFSSRTVTKKLGFRDKPSKQIIKELLIQLSNQGKVRQLRNGSFTSGRKLEYLTGIVDFVNPRFCYVVIPELDDDVWVTAANMNGALDGDRVKVAIKKSRRHGKRSEGSIEEIIERTRNEFVGKIEILDKYAFVVPDNRKMYLDIFIPPGKYLNAKTRDKVVVQVTEWPSGKNKKPIGEVTRVLGPAGENEAEIHSIMAEFGLPFEFPERIIAASEKIRDTISKSEIEKRKDFRAITTFTIDPADAKDFDDALSLEPLDNGCYRVGIHIADVTHYVKPTTPLDEEALERATSVYLVDRTIPMLPERLSNELCSLRPNEDKLTFSAVFEIDGNARVKHQWFGRTIIHSDMRFSYEDAQDRIEQVKGEFARELTILNELALKLRVNRFKRGAINFETTEVKFQLDEQGKPLAVIPKVRKDAHKMIEEFMLLANRKVAEYVFNRKKGKHKETFVYRIHDYPDPEKLTAFSVFARKFGHDLNIEEQAISKSFNNLIEDIEGKPEQDVLQQLAIRTMAKAKYTTEPKGHFGLAFDHYAHFTSPIRRYPDVMVHRLLAHYLENGNSVSKDEYEEMCVHSSDREKRASDAERASIKFKQVEYMQQMEGQEFEGIVSGVTEWGIYVEVVATKCEGMVRLADIKDDYYDFDEENYRVIGQRSKNIITLGDMVNVVVKRTDIDRRTIDLEMV
ncbi:MAG: ribonuclease R [Cyclobacteriaceae bacterium]|nr:MAG: ribonuclease R [Cyclobacteriaceae bacterium]